MFNYGSDASRSNDEFLYSVNKLEGYRVCSNRSRVWVWVGLKVVTRSIMIHYEKSQNANFLALIGSCVPNTVY